MLQARTHRGLMTEIPAQANDYHMWVMIVQGIKQVRRRVLAAIVDQEHFIVQPG